MTSTIEKPDPLILPGDEIRMMIYGFSGVGKTEILGSAMNDPRTSPVLWLDLEGGVKTIRSKCRTRIGDRELTVQDLGNPEPGLADVLRIREYKDIQSAYDFVFHSRFNDKRRIYRSIVVDSLTEVNGSALEHCKATDPNKALKLDPDVAQLRDYLACNGIMKKLLRGFRDLEGIHVWYSALPKQDEIDDPTNNLKYMKPNLIGKLADEAVGIMDYVSFLRADNKGLRELIFQPEGRIIAKEWSEAGKWIKTIKAKSVDEPITITQILDAVLGITPSAPRPQATAR